MQLTAQCWTTQSIRNTPVKSFSFLVCPLWVVSRWCNSFKIKISITLHRENYIWRFPRDSVVTSTERLLYQPWKKYSALFWQLCHSSGRKNSVFHSAGANAVISNPKHGRKLSVHMCTLLPTFLPPLQGSAAERTWPEMSQPSCWFMPYKYVPIASFPQAEGWIENIGLLLANKLSEFLSPSTKSAAL